MTDSDKKVTTGTPCWRTRNCAPQVQKYCQHAVTDYDMCPSICNFAFCYRPEHVHTADPAFVFEPNIDRSQALKQSCLYCEFFAKNGPKRDENAPRGFEDTHDFSDSKPAEAATESSA
ncbi:MAG: hypothetical protein FWE48_01055 [Coriobacteriia bacterium]|nr:hypothetical protein [Coriobacteriia bacterium]